MKAAAALLCLLCLFGCSQRRGVERVEWTTMGTIAAFQCRDAKDLEKAHIVRQAFAEVERLLNAHDPQSELSRLATLRDDEILSRCDALVRPCYEAAFRYRDATGRVFNPRFRGEGTMDLGAIAKGFAVDLAAERVGECDALIDLGGNLKACGGEWRVGIFGGDEVVVLRRGESCATSGEYYRGKHIKDGRTGGEVAGAAKSVTVVSGRSAMDADALSTILFILGREKGMEWFDSSRDPTEKAVWL